jgi:hypothetical protein
MKYQDESTKVSMVSVSRRAGLPQHRAVDLQEGLALVQRVAAAVGHQSSGSTTGRSFSGTGTAPWIVAVDDGDRRAPVALAADAPVAQAEGGLLLAQALAASSSATLFTAALWFRPSSCRS